MRTLPKSRDEFFAWAEAHRGAWAQHAAVLGLSAGEIAQYVEALQEARAAAQAQERAMNAAKAATLAAALAEARIRELSSLALATIRLTAARSDDPQIYTLALIAPPRKAAPLPLPGQPFDFKVSLMAQGSLQLSWQADHPSGSSHVTYEVFRTLDDDRDSTLLASVGEKTFIDTTLPRGTAHVTYSVRSRRGSRVSAQSLGVPVAIGVTPPRLASALRAAA
jgi:hypothetical protein